MSSVHSRKDIFVFSKYCYYVEKWIPLVQKLVAQAEIINKNIKLKHFYFLNMVGE